MSLATTDNVKGWLKPDMGATRDADLDRICGAADAWLKRITGWDIEQAASTIYLDGHDAVGRSRNVLLVPSKYRPVTHTEGGTEVQVWEDGSALSVNIGYDTTSDVVVVGANLCARAELVKPSSPWSGGYQNVKVTLTAGYAAGSVPADIVQLATEIAALMWRAQHHIGKASKSTRAGSATFEKDLTPQSQALLAELIEAPA